MKGCGEDEMDFVRRSRSMERGFPFQFTVEFPSYSFILKKDLIDIYGLWKGRRSLVISPIKSVDKTQRARNWFSWYRMNEANGSSQEAAAYLPAGETVSALAATHCRRDRATQDGQSTSTDRQSFDKWPVSSFTIVRVNQISSDPHSTVLVASCPSVHSPRPSLYLNVRPCVCGRAHRVCLLFCLSGLLAIPVLLYSLLFNQLFSLV